MILQKTKLPGGEVYFPAVLLRIVRQLWQLSAKQWISGRTNRALGFFLRSRLKPITRPLKWVIWQRDRTAPIGPVKAGPVHGRAPQIKRGQALNQLPPVFMTLSKRRQPIRHASGNTPLAHSQQRRIGADLHK